jgi:hypothetical protein
MTLTATAAGFKGVARAHVEHFRRSASQFEDA